MLSNSGSGFLPRPLPQAAVPGASASRYIRVPAFARFEATLSRLEKHPRSPRGPAHHCPTFGADFQGSRGSCEPPFCSSSTEMLSGERTKAIRPSRGGRLMVTP